MSMPVPEPTTALLRREIRQCALQAMYQMDAAAADVPASLEVIHESLEGMPGGDKARAAGVKLAELAWQLREQSDAIVAEVAEDWPIYRQPMIDRNLLRLCCYEILSGRTPYKVAINEAVEIAKEFGSEKTPMFINGVLDKLVRDRPEEIEAARAAWNAQSTLGDDVDALADDVPPTEDG